MLEILRRPFPWAANPRRGLLCCYGPWHAIASLKIQEVAGDTSLTCKISPARGGRTAESSRVRTAMVVP